VDLYSTFIVVHSRCSGYGSHNFTCKLHNACLYLASIHQTAPSLMVADI